MKKFNLKWKALDAPVKEWENMNRKESDMTSTLKFVDSDTEW